MNAEQPSSGLNTLPGDDVRQILWRFADRYELQMLAQSARGVARGPVWNCGFIDPPAHLPFGDPLTQPSAGGLAQPLRRMLGTTLLAAREEVVMPEPGDTGAARHASRFADPAWRVLFDPAARLRDRLAERAEWLRDLTITQCLSLSFGALILMLVLLAAMQGAWR